MIRLFVLILLLLPALRLSAQSGLSVSPARLFFHSADKSRTQHITLTNTVDRPVRWLLSVQDWDRDSLGRKRFFDAGALPHSCAAWLQIVPNEIEVPAKGQVMVAVTFQGAVPERRSLHAMVMINEAPRNGALEKGSKKASIEVKAAFAIHVYAVNDAGSKSLEIENFRYDAAGIALELSLRNTGEQPLDTKIDITVTDRNSNREWKLPEASSATLPGAYRSSRFALPDDMPKGNYMAIGTLDCGDDLPLKVAELSFDR